MTPEAKMRLEEAVWVDPERMSGTPCFRGTRVPVQSLVDALESGETVDQFLAVYTSITREQVYPVLLMRAAKPHLDDVYHGFVTESDPAKKKVAGEELIRAIFGREPTQED